MGTAWGLGQELLNHSLEKPSEVTKSNPEPSTLCHQTTSFSATPQWSSNTSSHSEPIAAWAAALLWEKSVEKEEEEEEEGNHAKQHPALSQEAQPTRGLSEAEAQGADTLLDPFPQD